MITVTAYKLIVLAMSCRNSFSFMNVVFQSTTKSMQTFLYSTTKQLETQNKVVVLEKGKAKLFQDGNPLIYGGAIKSVLGSPDVGCIVEVTDHLGNQIGKGVYNPHSTYRVRMLSRSYEAENSLGIKELLISRVNQAISLRRSIFLPSSETTVYRLINGEGDRLGGLIVDILGSTVVIQSSALWVEHYRVQVEYALKYCFGTQQYRFIWRRAESRLNQDGYRESRIHEVDPCLLSDLKHNVDFKIDETETVIENGIKYAVYPDDGQKTGFYCDQRANREVIRQLSKGKTILDTYSYSGGFSISAALGGAHKVITVDSSQAAIEMAQKNSKLNGVENVIKCVKADALKHMKSLQDDGAMFDIVICDPPKLAPTRKDLDRAKNKYTKINSMALSLVRPGGLLLTCTCSAAVTQSGDFRRIISDAARVAKRDITVLSSSSAGGDHPVHIGYPEGEYLTALLVAVT